MARRRTRVSRTKRRTKRRTNVARRSRRRTSKKRLKKSSKSMKYKKNKASLTGGAGFEDTTAYKIYNWDISYTHNKFYLTGERPEFLGWSAYPEQIRSEIENIFPDGAIADGDTTSEINENSFYTIITNTGRHRKMYDLILGPEYLKHEGKLFNLLGHYKKWKYVVDYSKVRGIFEGIYNILHSSSSGRQPNSLESEIKSALS